MSRKKLHRFEHNQQAWNVIERGKEAYTTIKGNWASHFRNANPLILELACGKGEYSVGLGTVYPNKNFIGIDIKGDRIARGSKKALELSLKNVSFLRTSIQYLDEFFNEKEIAEIWLIHPDPQPRDKEEKRRLTNINFLNLYHKYIVDNGIFHLKTDSEFLYLYTLDVLKQHEGYQIIEFSDDLYDSELLKEHFQIQTHYEKLFTEKGHKIHYIKAKKVNYI